MRRRAAAALEWTGVALGIGAMAAFWLVLALFMLAFIVVLLPVLVVAGVWTEA